jgi:LL-diaminopimelate aminotransferase
MEAMKKACEDPENYKYALADLPELLGAVAAHYKKRYGVALSRDEIMSVYGSQEGIAHIAFPLCNPGDTVIVTNPGYPVFSYGPILAGTELYSVPILKENNFLIDFDAIDEAAAKKAKLMIVSYPNNPVAVTAPRSFYEKLVAFAKNMILSLCTTTRIPSLFWTGSRVDLFFPFRAPRT